jgi:exodeoxyribonuclease VII large subunit
MQATTSDPVVLSVSELTFAIKSQLEPLFRRVWVRGEVSNLRLQASGHIYFSLIDGSAQLSAVLFRGNASTLQAPLKNGDTIIAQGEISIYPPKGSYQLVIRELSLFGLGESLLKLQALKKKLAALGWFKPERKRPLPKEIQKIGVVTSPTGAVIQDILTILTRRLGGFHLLINPVRVQGEGAASEVSRAIAEFNTYNLVDVIIVCRGGGSTEDLAAFNDENVAKACFESKIPIVSAIGHETDLSVADLVADLRAPTPSAAAELVSQERTEQKKQILLLYKNILHNLQDTLAQTSKLLQLSKLRLNQASPLKQIEYKSLRLDDLENSITSAVEKAIHQRRQLLNRIRLAVMQLSPLAKLANQKENLVKLEKLFFERFNQRLTQRRLLLTHLSKSLITCMYRRIDLVRTKFMAKNWITILQNSLAKKVILYRQKLLGMEKNLNSLHPQRTLERGYAIVVLKNSNRVVRSVNMVQPNDAVSIRVADGILSAHVIDGTTQ